MAIVKKKKKNVSLGYVGLTCSSANANKLENPPLTANKLHPVRQSLQVQRCGMELRRASRYIRVRRVVCNSTLRYLYSGVCMTRMTDCAGAQHSACSILSTGVTGFAKVACFLCTASCLQTSANVAGECVQNVHNVTWEGQKARTYLYNLPWYACTYIPVLMATHA